MKDFLINEQIRSAIVVVIASDGEKKGQFTKAAAIQMARNESLDLIQLNSENPPVCKIADYGKMRFKASKAEKKQHTPEQKEMWFHTGTQQHDVDIKMRKVSEWLVKGHKVRVVVKLDGREKYDPKLRKLARDRLGVYTAPQPGVFTSSEIKDEQKDIWTMLTPAVS